MSQIKVFIADDFALYRKGVALFLSRNPVYEIIGEAGDGLETVKEVLRLEPDVVIMDINMPKMNGIEATERIMEERPNIKILALSMYDDVRYASEAFKAGARGYVVKGSDVEELPIAIEKIMSGKLYSSPSVTDGLLEDYVDNMKNEGARNIFGLTPREKEVLKLICEGASAKVISKELYISENTVKTHRAHIMKKLDVKDKASLVRIALSKELVSLNLD